jgi:hypothetical protein
MKVKEALSEKYGYLLANVRKKADMWCILLVLNKRYIPASKEQTTLCIIYQSKEDNRVRLCILINKRQQS